MADKQENIRNDEFVKASFILFILISAANVLNYLFHFFMARILGPSDYGVLAVLMSFFYIFSIPSEAIQTIISRYTSKYFINKEYGKMKNLFSKSLKKGIKISVISYIILVLVGCFMAYLLKIDYGLIFITSLIVIPIFIVPLSRGILQGQRKFKEMGLNLVFESLVRLLVAIGLVSIGFRVYGAITGVLMGFVLAFFLGLFPIKKILKTKSEKIETKFIYDYSWQVFIIMFSWVLLYNVDVILAKRFFSSTIAGQYAVVSLLGKMILFGTIAISKVMFPLISEKHEMKQKTSGVLKKSIVVALAVSSIALFFYLLFPTLIVNIFFGKQYTDVANILFIEGLALTFVSLTTIIMFYLLSVNKTKKASYHFPIFVVIQLVLLALLHKTLLEFSISFLISNILIFLYSIFLIKDDLNNNSGI